MAQYTMQLKDIDSVEYNNSLQYYDIFNESYRNVLNDKIFKSLRFKEIGFETPEGFLEHLDIWMCLHMPDYNHMYNAMLVNINPLQRQEFIETLVKDVNRVGSMLGDTTQSTDGTTGTVASSTNTNTSTGSNLSSEDSLIKSNSSQLINNSVINSTLNSGTSNESTTQSNTSTQDTDNTDTTKQNSKQDNYQSDFPQGNIPDAGVVSSNYYSKGDNSVGEDTVSSTIKGKVIDTNTGSNQVLTGSSDKSDTTNTTTGDTTGSDNTTNSTDISSSDSKESTDIGSSKVDNTSKITASGTNTQSNTTDELENYTLKRSGNLDKTDFELLEQYKKMFINVDLKLITSIKKDLFMSIW